MGFEGNGKVYESKTFWGLRVKRCVRCFYGRRGLGQREGRSFVDAFIELVEGE